MPFTALRFSPGINREVTPYANEGGWVDGDKVRFRMTFPESIGGWELYSDTIYLGTCRDLFAWTALNGTKYLSLGTSLKWYLEEGTDFFDITPLRATTAAGDVTFAAADNTLASNLAAGELMLSLTSSTGFPTAGRIKINSEEITYTGISGNDLTGLTRGVSGTTDAAHSATDVVLCSTLTVTDTAHGAGVNDFVTFSGCATLGGNITAAILDQEYQVLSVPTDNTYTVDAREVGAINATLVYAFANSSDSGSGGAGCIGAYQISTGTDTTVSGTGWGAGVWSRGAWGSGAPTTTPLVGSKLRIWSLDAFGEDLLGNIRGGGIYYWDANGGTTTRAVSLDSLAGATETPTVANQVLVSDRDRHIIAFGCNPQGSSVQDPLLIRFSDQENLLDWSNTATNTGGELRLGIGSEIIQAVETRLQTLVFTDQSLHVMQYKGAPYTFGIDVVSVNTDIASPNAAIAIDDTVFWMGKSHFHVFDGQTQHIPCTIRDYVYDDFNITQSDAVVAGNNSKFGEIWWLYPSASSDRCDRYVVFNYMEKVWFYGTLERDGWLDQVQGEYPVAAGPNGTLYYHEKGYTDGSTSPASAITSYIESAPMDIEDGHHFSFISKILPDITFLDSPSPSAAPSLTMTVKAKQSPGTAYTQTDDGGVTQTATLPVELFTDMLDIRVRGRSFSFRIDASTDSTAWRLGVPRVDIRPDGRR